MRGAISVRDRSHPRAAPFEWARESLSSEPKEASRAGTARKARPNAGCLAISRVSNDIALVCLSGMSQEREVSGAGCLAILCQQERTEIGACVSKFVSMCAFPIVGALGPPRLPDESVFSRKSASSGALRVAKLYELPRS